jgi:hypothetical protein
VADGMIGEGLIVVALGRPCIGVVQQAHAW